MSTDPANSCALFITVHSHSGASRKPALSARFQFEDHIRCVAARQCLQRNRENLRLAKMARVAKLLHLPSPDRNSDTSMPASNKQSSTSSISNASFSGSHELRQEIPSTDSYPPEVNSMAIPHLSEGSSTSPAVD